ncbi:MULTISPECIES: MFS transporter [Carboxydocella]|uniref:Predicted arabinose efflux permease, MFS family n=2 Tax=Carboxydocella TaxID=178898 RepID=A0A1T4RJK5_9FIRM|nr:MULTISPECIES: MFS transporter [Carboxydocella]AVX20788.1 putative arabinose efflux permease, MFS family [Carboxydocella thermautotrophica]GAW32112.1 hypothetical protein JDF658_18770 [Carboxydocella sp. JDF658]SKA15928.1 Predicted arabinose efflux permease, MFS family [Carboxydocella sporoproducens DSM 16521]
MNFTAFLSENRNFRFLWLSQLISALGDWISYVALTLFVIDRYSNSVQALAWITLSKTLAILFFGPLGGAMADQHNRKKLMVIADLSRFFLTLLLLFSPPLWALTLIVFALNILSCLFTPAYYAIIPELVEEKNLLAANSINGVTANSVWLLGTLIGGVMVAAIGYRWAFLFDALSFLLSALFLAFINYRSQKTAHFSLLMPFQQTYQGLREIKKSPPHLIMFAVVFGFFLAGGFYNFVQPLIIRKELGLAEVYYSYALALTGGLMILTSFLLGKYGQRVPRPLLVQISVLLGGIAFILLGWQINWATVVIAAALVGISNSFGGLGMRTFMQEITPNELRGKVFGLIEPIINSAMAIAAFGGMVVLKGLGYNWPLKLSGIFLILVLFLAIALNRYNNLQSDLSQQNISA